MKDFIIFGAGAHAREVYDQIIENRDHVLGFIVDNATQSNLYGVPVTDIEVVKNKDAGELIIAIGNPYFREKILQKSNINNFRIGRLISNRAFISPSATIGEGAQIFANTIISSGVHIGVNSIVNYSCTISHDCYIGQSSTISPGVCIGGNVHIGKGVVIGIGATIRNGSADNPLQIGDYAVVGAGACVISSIPAGQLALGLPARVVGAAPSDPFKF